MSDWRGMPGVELTPILAAALDAFYEQGFHGASVRDVAARVGLTVPSLYYHHDSKEGLLFAVLEKTMLNILERVDLAAADGATASIRLSHAIESLVLSMTTMPRAASVDNSESRYLTGENRTNYAAIRRRIEDLVDEIVIDGVKSGEFAVDDVAEVVRAILGMTQAIPRWYDLQGRDSPEETADHYAAMALKLVRA